MKSPKSNTTHIIAGQYKGAAVQVPAVAHPMGTREKNALFNMLGSFLAGATVLDAYAGSGALGLEALSRGAAAATFLDQSPAAIRALKTNLQLLPPAVAQKCQVIHRSSAEFHPAPGTSRIAGVAGDAETSARLYPAPDANYQIILIDPPYDDYHPADFLHLAQYLAPNGHLALSHPTATPPEFPGLNLIQTKKYARCHLSLFA